MPHWRWAALLSFALVAPAALPAGGAERRLPEVRRRQQPCEPLACAAAVSLHCAPQQHAPVISRTEIGEPLQVLRQWFGGGGERWLRVEQLSTGRRGWLAG